MEIHNCSALPIMKNLRNIELGNYKFMEFIPELLSGPYLLRYKLFGYGGYSY